MVVDGKEFVSEVTEHLHDHSSPWSELVCGASSTDGEVLVRVGERRTPRVTMVTRPLERTVHTVREVVRGKLGTTGYLVG